MNTRWLATAIALFLLGGCASTLLPKPQEHPTLLTLDNAALWQSPAQAQHSHLAKQTLNQTLVVDVPRASAGFDTREIAYIRGAPEISYYASHLWIDTPARMLVPLIVHALERNGAFRAVAIAPTSAQADLRLETKLIRLQQEFTTTPSRERLTLRALLTQVATRRVIAAREFDVSWASKSEDAPGGASAGAHAARQVAAEVAQFCADNAAR
jgi:cholesterol transport system auxiliary component